MSYKVDLSIAVHPLKKVYLSVINDLVVDHRVHKMATTLLNVGADVTLIGRRFAMSQSVSDRPYKTIRFKLLFKRGFLFYAFFNVRLFFYLLFAKKGILVSNDLDTLPANFLISRIRNLSIVYDSHEYFTEVPELLNRGFVRRIWLKIEGSIVPRLNHIITVSESIAVEYNRIYGKNVEVIRNLPSNAGKEARRPDELECGPKRVIIYQGSLNMGRGIEEMIRAMQYLEQFVLQIFGDGLLKKILRRLASEMNVADRVQFMGRIPFGELKKYTRQASVGISLERNIGRNYYYALPNKLFDYIHAQVPVLVSDLPEMRKIVESYDVGVVSDTYEPEKLANIITNMMDNHELREKWKKNLRVAVKELNWENQEEKIISIYRSAGLSV